MNTISYNSSEKIPVLIGDRVRVKIFWFWKYTGTVVYVPGMSPVRRDMETEQFRRICIKTDGGDYRTEEIASDGQLANANVIFMNRQSGIASLQPSDIISEDDKFRQELDSKHPPMPGIRLVQTATPGKSKLGGLPNLPVSVPWPKNPEGIELDLLAQIHCPELPKGLGFPETGTLFFFYDCKQQFGEYGERARVVYTGEPLPDMPRTRTVPRRGYDDSCQTFIKPEQYESFASDVLEMGGYEANHQMLGYPLWIQRDETPEDRLLLLQIDSDTTLNPEWMWGDAGRIYFLISPAALAAKDFDQTELECECY